MLPCSPLRAHASCAFVPASSNDPWPRPLRTDKLMMSEKRGIACEVDDLGGERGSANVGDKTVAAVEGEERIGCGDAEEFAVSFTQNGDRDVVMFIFCAPVCSRTLTWTRPKLLYTCSC